MWADVCSVFFDLINLALIWVLFLVGLFGIPFFVIRSLIRNRREDKQLKKQVSETIATLEKKEKIARKPGRYVPKNWAAKWVAYSKDLPAPRANPYENREIPPPPKRDE